MQSAQCTPGLDHSDFEFSSLNDCFPAINCSILEPSGSLKGFDWTAPSSQYGLFTDKVVGGWFTDTILTQWLGNYFPP